MNDREGSSSSYRNAATSLDSGGGSLESISEQLARIQRYQEDALQKKDRELELLRNQIEQQRTELFRKDVEIRHLERERYRQQEERALELGSLVRRGAHHVNPYQTSHGDESFCEMVVNRICNPVSAPNFRTPPQHYRLTDRIMFTIFCLFLLHLYNLSLMQPQFKQIEDNNVARYRNSDPIYSELEAQRLKPWESTPPKPIAFMSVRDPFVQRRHTCIQQVRQRQTKIFQQVLGQDPLQILLVDPAYHSNVGDHMLTVGELELVQTSLKLEAPKQCHYIQAGGFYDVCTDIIRNSDATATNKVALWHAGGNWGDLWRDAQDIRIPSMKTILENGYKLIGMPQSLFYLDKSLKTKDATSIKEKVALGLKLASQEDRRRRLEEYMWDEEGNGGWGNWGTTAPAKPVNTSALDTPEGIQLAQSRTIFMWREKESWEEASVLYPFVTNMIVPDMAFQLGPYAPIRNHPTELVDIIIFLRKDHESKVDSERNEDSIRRILPKSDLTFKIVEWSDRLDIFGTTDTFFTDTSIELLSLGKVVVCDRLHASILSYLSGLPFVYIDQVSGKITKTLTTALEEHEGCMDGEQALWARAWSLREALAKASEMIDKHRLDHGRGGFLRRFINF